ncbi:DsbC family protein [Thiomicrospira sp. ALE5]|uniref:DsbC family protein n=1 Tax=Thiomicrospira sp. ALE5 TaxID=748650 RepID=UPI0008E51EAB|nr:DsbC family protein [Thiomicrospira sp. ALE5]SFR54174.1 thiol:disulfide interchange protein DsbC [Thiomicrospira sp. ALE5]
MIKSIQSLALAALMGASAMMPAMADTQRIQQVLSQMAPGAPAADIQPSVIPGLYEVTLGVTVFYMTADGEHLFNGNLINLEQGANLTEKRLQQARLEALNDIDPASMIVFKAKGDTKRQITVFTDIDCPFCKRFHNQVGQLNEAGIEVRYLAFPRSGPSTPSFTKMESVWCSANPVKAMDDAKNGMDPETKRCDNPVMSHFQAAQFFNVSGTPTMIIDDGQMVPGFVPAEDLIPALLEN